MELSIIENLAVDLLRLAVIKLPGDVIEALRKAYVQEESIVGKTQLAAILENIRIAEEEGIPICQDTGLISFYISAGSNFRNLEKIEKTLEKAVRRASYEIPLRPNTLDPFTNKNTNDNTGKNVPYIIWRITKGDFLEITVFPKGGGSENMCALKMMNPSEGLSGIKKFVIERVVQAGGMPCPPSIIGIGIGGGSNISMELAKTALLRPLNKPNKDETASKLERILYKEVNQTGIGPMGLGGNSTTLGVNVEYAYRHPASFPVAIAFQCWAARKAAGRIHSNGEVEYLTHTL